MESGEHTYVEEFAYAFVEKQLESELTDFVPKDRQRFGYDREARRKIDGALVKIEVKGQKGEGPIQLGVCPSNCMQR